MTHDGFKIIHEFALTLSNFGLLGDQTNSVLYQKFCRDLILYWIEAEKKDDDRS